MTTPLALAVLLAQAAAAPTDAAPAPALQPLWRDFERLRLPAASTGEDSQALEDALAGLRAREEACVDRLPHAASLSRQSEELKAALDRGGADLAPAQVGDRLRKCGDELKVTMPPDAARGTPFELIVEGPGAKTGLSNTLPCAITALPTWRLTRVEAGPEGWVASGQLSLLGGTSAPAPLPDAPEKGKGESRRSSELRMRIGAIRPGVVACEEKLTAAGIAGIDELETRVEQTDHLRARDSIVRPSALLAIGLSNIASTRPQTLVVKEVGDQVQLEVTPLAAGVALRKKVRNSNTGIRPFAETITAEKVTLTVNRRQTPRALEAAGTVPDDESLARLLELMAAVRTRGASTVSQLEPELAKATRELLDDAETIGGLMDDARTYEERTTLARAALDLQGMALDDAAVTARITACGAEIDGKLPARGAAPVKLLLKGSLETTPTVPWACLRAAFRSIRLDRFVRSNKTWKLTAELFLDAETTGGAAPAPAEEPKKKKGKKDKETPAAAAPVAPAPPEGLVAIPAIPAAPLAQPKSRHPDAKPWRAKLLELHAFLKAQHERLAALPLGAAEKLEARYDRLAQFELWNDPLAAFATTVFTPPENVTIPPWMDFVTSGTEVKLNMAPKDEALGLMSALRAAGCRTIKTKSTGDSLRAEIDCGPK